MYVGIVSCVGAGPFLNRSFVQRVLQSVLKIYNLSKYSELKQAIV